MPSAASWFGGALALLSGAIVGTLFTVAHRATFEVLGVALPIGFVLGLIAVAALVAGLRLLAPDRLPAIGAAVGVVGAIMVLAAQGDSGSVLVTGEPVGIAWLTLPSTIAAVAIAWPRRRESRARS